MIFKKVLSLNIVFSPHCSERGEGSEETESGDGHGVEGNCTGRRGQGGGGANIRVVLSGDELGRCRGRGLAGGEGGDGGNEMGRGKRNCPIRVTEKLCIIV